MARRKKEFVDRDHAVMNDYYDIIESFTGRNTKTTKAKLAKLIQLDPDFLDPYLMLAEMNQREGDSASAEKLLDQAYERAIAFVADKKGNWPEVMEWGWMENRHIIRTLVRKGVSLWSTGENEKALDLFRRILKTNPGDNPGVRYFILAIREGMSFAEHEERFNKGGYYDMEISDWFEEHHGKYPDDFEWWDKEMEKCA